MGCFKKLCSVALLVVLVIVLLTMSPCKSSTCSRERDVVFPTDITPINDMLPPNDGPSILLDEPKKKADDPNVKAPKISKIVGVNAANAAWYNTIYHGGTLTKLPNSDAMEETAQLYNLNISQNPAILPHR